MIRKDITTRFLADGSHLSIPVFHFPGSHPHAKKVYIQSGIHASEVQGYLVSLHLIDLLLKNPPLGDITIVPIANPYALNLKSAEYTFGRFDPVTGDNWNRHYLDLTFLATDFLQKNSHLPFPHLLPLFKTTAQNYIQNKLHTSSLPYSQKIALQLQQLAFAADIVLDLHCDTISLPHLYSPTYSIPSSLHFSIPFIIEIPHLFRGALDEAIFCPWIHLTQQYNYHHQSSHPIPIEAFTIELGNQETLNNTDAIHHSHCILNYLSTKQVIKNFPIVPPPLTQFYSCSLENFKTIYASHAGMITHYSPFGIPLQSQDILYTFHKIEYLRSNQSMTKNFMHDLILHKYSDQESIILTHTSSPIFHEGMPIMKIMTQLTTHPIANRFQ